MRYDVLTTLALPVVERHDNDGRPVFSGETTLKREGDTTSTTELEAHGQSPADVANLVKGKAIKEKKT